MNRNRSLIAGLSILCCLGICTPGYGTSGGDLAVKLPKLASTQPDFKYHFGWQNLSINIYSNLRSKQVHRRMYLNGSVRISHIGSLSSLGQAVVLTRLEIDGHVVIDKPVKEQNRSQYFSPVTQQNRSNTRGLNLTLPDDVLPGDHINIIKGFLPAYILLKSRVNSYALDKKKSWIYLGKRLTPLSIKFKKLVVGDRKADIEVQFKGKSAHQFIVNYMTSSQHVLPRIGSMWLEDDAGHKQPIEFSSFGGSASDKGFTGHGTAHMHWNTKRKFTTLKIKIIDEVKPVKLEFTVHDLHIPAFKRKHCWDKK